MRNDSFRFDVEMRTNKYDCEREKERDDCRVITKSITFNTLKAMMAESVYSAIIRNAKNRKNLNRSHGMAK